MYRRTSRALKRMESTSRSPILANFSGTLHGIVVINAYGVQDVWIRRHDVSWDNNFRFFFLNMSCSRWAGVRFELIGLSLVAFVCLYICIFAWEISAGLAGASLSNIILILRTIQNFVRSSVELELSMNAVERVNYYTTMIPSEQAADDKELGVVTPTKWPSKGEIVFENLSLQYRPGLPTVLSNFNLRISGRSKVGIVGRTGSGKSTIALSLFRLLEAQEGNITIDGIDISTRGLSTLRSRMGIVPQSPTLFSGTIRSNVDPMGKLGDEALWQIMKKVSLEECLRAEDTGLDTPVEAGGTNWSVGERQLICLARALVIQPKVLVLDECSASVDYKTDEMLQKMIKTEFADITVVTIAHRIDTVLHCDQIIVLDGGKLVEFGPPDELLLKADSIFGALVREGGTEENESGMDCSKTKPSSQTGLDTALQLAPRSHYDTLGVDPGADLKTIKRAFHEKARLVHPDKARIDSKKDSSAVSSSTAFTAVQEASLARKRDRYSLVYVVLHYDRPQKKRQYHEERQQIWVVSFALPRFFHKFEEVVQQHGCNICQALARKFKDAARKPVPQARAYQGAQEPTLLPTTPCFFVGIYLLKRPRPLLRLVKLWSLPYIIFNNLML